MVPNSPWEWLFKKILFGWLFCFCSVGCFGFFCFVWVFVGLALLVLFVFTAHSVPLKLMYYFQNMYALCISLIQIALRMFLNVPDNYPRAR